MTQEVGPIYEVPLIRHLPIGQSMFQAMPGRAELVEVARRNERVVAAYEVLLNRWQAAEAVLDKVREQAQVPFDRDTNLLSEYEARGLEVAMHLVNYDECFRVEPRPTSQEVG
jgi:hypothetical protein